MELIIVTLITTLGLIIVEFLRRSNNNVKELKVQIGALQDEVDELRKEVVHWQSKYLESLRKSVREIHEAVT